MYLVRCLSAVCIFLLKCDATLKVETHQQINLLCSLLCSLYSVDFQSLFYRIVSYLPRPVFLSVSSSSFFSFLFLTVLSIVCSFVFIYMYIRLSSINRH